MSPDGARFAVGLFGSARVLVYDSSPLALKTECQAGGNQPPLALSRTLLAQGGGQRINLFELPEARPLDPLPEAESRDAQALTFRRDGKVLAYFTPAPGFAPGLVRLWDVAGRRTLNTIRVNPQGRLGLALSPDGLSVAFASERDKYVRLYEAATGREYASLVGHAEGATVLAYSPDGKVLASADGKIEHPVVRLWDTTRCREMFKLTGHTRGINTLAFSPDGKTLATASDDSLVKLWDLGSGKLLHERRHAGCVAGAGFGPGGDTLLVAGNWFENNICRWDLRDIPQLKKRPPAQTPDLDRSAAPEVPEPQLAGRIESHLAAVVNVKEGYLLAFTRDRLCLHYSYPELKLKGTYWTGALVYRAVLDASKGVVYAAVSDLRSLKVLPQNAGWEGQGPVHVYDVKALLAGKLAGGKLKPSAVVEVNGKLSGLFLGAEGRWLCYHDTRDFFKPVLGRIDTTTNKAGDKLELTDRPSQVRMAPDGKTAYAIGQQPGGQKGYVLPIDVATLKAGKKVDVDVAPLEVAVSEDYLVVSGRGPGFQHGIFFLDRKKDDLPIARRWLPLFVAPPLAVAGDRLLGMSGVNSSRLDVYPLTPKVDGRPPQARGGLDSTDEQPLEPNYQVTPDGKHVLFTTGVLLRLDPGLVLPRALKEEARGEAEKPAGKLRQRGAWKDGHRLRVLALAWSARGRRVLSGGEDRLMLVRLASDGKVEHTLRSTTGPVHAVAWARDNRLWAAATWRTQHAPTGTTYIVNAVTNVIGQHKQGGLAAGVDTIAFGPDAKLLAAASDKGLVVWNAGPFRPGAERTIATTVPLTGVAVAPGNGLVAAGGLDGLVRLFELNGDKEKGTLKGHDGEVRCVAISPDGKTVVSGGIDGEVKVWDVEGNKERHALKGHKEVVLSVALACDGKLAASGGLDGSIRLWDAATGKQVADEPAGEGGPVYALAFSPDGKTLAAAVGREVRQYDTAALIGTPLKIEPPPGGEITPPSPKPGPRTVFGFGLSQAGAVVDAQDRYVLAVTRQGLLRRLSYPDFKLTASYRLDRFVHRIAYDRATKTLYAVKVSNVFVGRDRETRGNDPELLVYAVGKLRPKGGQTSLAAQARFKLDGAVGQMALAPDGKYLYYLDVKDNKLRRVDLSGQKVDRGVDVPSPTALGLTADGKTIWVGSSPDGKQGKLHRLTAPEMEEKGTHAVDMVPREVAATDDGMVAFCGVKGTENMAWMLDSARDYKPRYSFRGSVRLSLALSSDQKRVFVCPHKRPPLDIRRWTTTRDVPALARMLHLEGKGRIQGGEVTASPDGQFLLLPAVGLALKVPKE
jgi:WD40 repeat protein